MICVLVHNLFFLALWALFFYRFPLLGGWSFSDMQALIALSCGSFGLTLLLLDFYEKLPAPALSSKGFGHLLTTLLLIILGDFASKGNCLLLLFCLLTGCAILTSTAIILYMLSLRYRRLHSYFLHYYDYLLLLTMYPTHIYPGAWKVLLFTAAPIGITGTIPVELLRRFSLTNFCILTAFALIFCLSAFLLSRKYAHLDHRNAQAHSQEKP